MTMQKMPNINSRNSKDKDEVTSNKTPKTAGVLLNILVCPDTKGLLIYDSKAQELISIQGKKAYPIEHYCPLLSEHHCRELSVEEVSKWQSTFNRK